MAIDTHNERYALMVWHQPWNMALTFGDENFGVNDQWIWQAEYPADDIRASRWRRRRKNLVSSFRRGAGGC